MRNLEDIYALAPAQQDLFGEAPDPAALGRCVSSIRADVRFEADAPGTGSWLNRWNEAWGCVLQRHAVLRTLFAYEAGARTGQQIVRLHVDNSWTLHDLRALPSAQRGHEEQLLAEVKCHEPLELTQAPLVRGALLLLSPDTVRLILAFHPLVLDSSSAARAVSELLAVHTSLGRAEGMQTPPVRPFRSYLAWLESQDVARCRAFWAEHLSRANPDWALPPVRASESPPDPGILHIEWDEALTHDLTHLTRSVNESLDTAVAAAWSLVLGRGSTASTLFGLSVRAAAPGNDAWRDTLGPFTRVLPLCIRVEPGAEAADAIRSIARQRDSALQYCWVPRADMLGSARLNSVVVGPPLTIAAPPGVVIDNVVLEAWSPAPLQITVAANGLDARFDLRRIDRPYVSRVCADLQQELERWAGRGSAREGANDSIRVTSPAADLSAIERVLARHPAVGHVRVSIQPDQAGRGAIVADVQVGSSAGRPIEFSLFYFADADATDRRDRYRLYLESARYADRHGFTAVWTPERHFHENGGLYPNPSVLSAALAASTERVGLRAGSVALPLHHTLRVAEEWAVVDNLSGGRVGLSFASGWIPNDFAFFPERYPDKRAHMFRQIRDLQKLWEGGSVPARDGKGNDCEVRIFPRPIQARLPIWITCSEDPSMFRQSAELGFKSLTSLILLSFEEVAERIAIYRNRMLEVSGGVERGHVTLMIHAFVGESDASTRALVRPALSKFLETHVALIKTTRKDPDPAPQLDAEQLVSFAFERYYRGASLMGGLEKCAAMVERLRGIGVDELACLIDFGLDVDVVLSGLNRLEELRQHFARRAETGGTAEALESQLQEYLRAQLPGASAATSIRIASAPGLQGQPPAQGQQDGFRNQRR